MNFDCLFSRQDGKNSHLLLSGEPGTGKSQLLLIKAILMAHREDVDNVVFLFDESKKDFRKWLISRIDNYPDLKRKHKIHGLGRQARYVFLIYEELFLPPIKSLMQKGTSFC